MDVSDFRRLLRKFEQVTAVQADVCCMGVTVPQCHALLEIEQSGELTIGGLAEKLNLDKSTLSRTVDSLVRLGLVDRIVNPEDRRYALVRLTSDGIDTCARINHVNDEFYQRIIDLIPVHRRDDLMDAIKLLVQATHEQVAKSGCDS